MLAVAAIAGCSDTPQHPSLVEPDHELAPSANAHRSAQLQRSGGGRNWAHASPEELWREISQTDSTLIVGLTAPGQQRGVRNGEVAISRPEWNEAHNAVVHVPGVTLVDRDTLLPTLRVKVGALETVRKLNRLPLVAYLEPAVTSLFATGASAGRQLWTDYSDANGAGGAGPGWTDTCGHGTHQASVIAAPMNGQNIMGVAWKANLAAIRHNGNVWGGFDMWDTNQAIDLAAGTYNSSIISMAFGSADFFTSMRDKIRYWYN